MSANREKDEIVEHYAALPADSAKAQADAIERKIQLGEVDPQTFKAPGSNQTLAESQEEFRKAEKKMLDDRDKADTEAVRAQQEPMLLMEEDVKLVSNIPGQVQIMPAAAPLTSVRQTAAVPANTTTLTANSELVKSTDSENQSK